jgi:hypothetical protein
MKTLALFCVVCVVALLYFVLHEQSIIKSQQVKIEKLSAEVSKIPESKGGSLELQEKCAAQANRTFKDMGYKPNAIAGYENHYNDKMNKCFMEVGNTDTTSPPTIWTFRSLLDAYEGKSYAEYSWHTDKKKKYWEVPPFSCRVSSLSGEDQYCKSEDEYKKLIKIYMEN